MIEPVFSRGKPTTAEAREIRRRDVHRYARVALLSALALVLSYLESTIPLPLAIPGVKLGLANAAVVVALFAVDWPSAALVALVKVVASGFLFGSPAMLAYSASGTALAFLAMLALRAVPGMGAVPVSIAAAIFHNIGQLLVASFFLGSIAVMVNAAPLGVAALVTGALTGGVAEGVLASMKSGGVRLPVRADVDFSIEPGEVVAFVGPNGSGKTTFALQMAGLVDGDDARALSVVSDDMLSFCQDEGIALVGVAFQDPDDQIVCERVADDVAFGLENACMERASMEGAVGNALASFDVSELSDRAVQTLSGGQRQRVACAGLAALRPAVYVFDETSAMLDPVTRASFGRRVRELAASGHGVVVITHDCEEVLAADRVAAFRGGRLRWVHTARELKSDPNLVVKALRGAVPAGAATPICAPSPSAAACGDGGRPRGGARLVARGLSFAYPASTASALRDVDCAVAQGEVVALCGVSGSGKTTLAHCLAGLEAPRAGTVTVEGPGFAGALDSVALCMQHPERQLFAATAYDDVAFGPRRQGLAEDEVAARVESALRAVGLDAARARETSPFAYSGGEQRRLALAGVLALDRPFLVLDEPTAGLDASGVDELCALLAALRGGEQARGIVVITHDLVFAQRIADRAILMSRGAVAASGPAEILRDEGALASAGLAVRARSVEPEEPFASNGESGDREQAGPAGRFGVFRPGATLAHRLDPRAKIVFALLFIVAAFLAQTPLAFLLLALAAVASLRASGLTVADGLRTCRPFAWLLAFVFAFDALFAGGADAWAVLGPISIGPAGLLLGLVNVARFVLVLLGTCTLMVTTSPTALADGFARLLAPLRACGVKVDGLAVALGATFRFVPVFSDELMAVKRAQRSRGARFEEGGPAARLKAMAPVIVPLFVAAMRRSETLALALLNRGFDPASRRTCYRAYALGRNDVLVLVAGAALVALAVLASAIVLP